MVRSWCFHLPPEIHPVPVTKLEEKEPTLYGTSNNQPERIEYLMYRTNGTQVCIERESQLQLVVSMCSDQDYRSKSPNKKTKIDMETKEQGKKNERNLPSQHNTRKYHERGC